MKGEVGCAPRPPRIVVAIIRRTASAIASRSRAEAFSAASAAASPSTIIRAFRTSVGL
jgi:hypothetical protein